MQRFAPTTVLIVFAALFLSWAPVHAQGRQKKDPFLISVTGVNTFSAAPDCAEIRLGISTKAETAPGAFRVLITNMGNVVAALKKSGIDEKDLRTQTISLAETHKQKGDEWIPDGYAAGQRLHVTIRNRKAVASTLQVAVDNGANHFYGLSWHIDPVKQAAWAETALPQAIAQAKAKAEVLARLLGKKLGKLQSFSEHASAPRERSYLPMTSRQPQEAVPAGEQELKLSVTLVYELK